MGPQSRHVSTRHAQPVGRRKLKRLLGRMLVGFRDTAWSLFSFRRTKPLSSTEINAAKAKQLIEALPPNQQLDFFRSALIELLPSEQRIFIAREALASSLEDNERVHVPALIRRNVPMTNTWTYQNEKMVWDIRPDDKVLDIGSGGWPFSRATHLIDRHLAKTSHRTEALVHDARPLIVGDIHHLPFADQSFDFIFCSHVLEHLENPGMALREIMRVGKRGYLEMPTRVSDVMCNFTSIKDHHRWHALRLGNTIAMIEWQETERRDTGVTAFYSLLQSGYENPFQTLVENNWDFFFAQLHWTGSIDFLVIDSNGRIIDRSEHVPVDRGQ